MNASLTGASGHFPSAPAWWRRWAALPTLHRWLGHVVPALSARLARRLVLWPQPPAPQDWEKAALACAEPITFRFGQRALRWGHTGPVVLAMHGWEGRPSQFARLLPELLRSGRQVIALYAPAHLPGSGGDSNVLQFKQALLEAAAELRGVEAVVGHSMGGAAALMAMHEGLAAQRVATLAAPSALAGALNRSSRGLQLSRRAYRRFRRLVDQRLGVPAQQVDVARRVQGLAATALLVHDSDDRVVPVGEAVRLSRALPGSRLLITRGLRHNRALTETGVVREVVDFLCGRAG